MEMHTPMTNALLSACESGDVSAVRTVIELGVDPNTWWNDPNHAYRHGKSAVMWATRHGHIQIVQILIQCGADIHYVSKRDGNALHYAAFFGQTDIGALLIANGLSVDSRDPMWQRTPLHVAASNLRLGFAQMLIDAGANINALDHFGITPLDCASLYADTRTAELIQRSGGRHGRFAAAT